MKRCAYCGQDNGDDAASCQGCGGAQFIVAPTAPVEIGRVDKAAVLQSEIEAERLDAELKARNIPHVMRSYYDSALDGFYQFSGGWGHVEAPAEYHEQILAILEAIRENGLAPEGGAPGHPPRSSPSAE
jgi:hypothetical protein